MRKFEIKVQRLDDDDTYAKLHNEGVNNTSNDRNEIECIPRVFEKILEIDQYVSKDSVKVIVKLKRSF